MLVTALALACVALALETCRFPIPGADDCDVMTLMLSAAIVVLLVVAIGQVGR